MNPIRDFAALTASVATIIKATDLPPLPDDESESLGLAMRHVILWLVEERESVPLLRSEP